MNPRLLWLDVNWTLQTEFLFGSLNLDGSDYRLQQVRYWLLMKIQPKKINKSELLFNHPQICNQTITFTSIDWFGAFEFFKSEIIGSKGEWWWTSWFPYIISNSMTVGIRKWMFHVIKRCLIPRMKKWKILKKRSGTACYHTNASLRWKETKKLPEDVFA